MRSIAFRVGHGGDVVGMKNELVCSATSEVTSEASGIEPFNHVCLGDDHITKVEAVTFGTSREADGGTRWCGLCKLCGHDYDAIRYNMLC